MYATSDQCQSKWKKLEQKYKDVKFHNSQTGNNRKEWEFYDLMEEVIGNNPKVVPVCTVSSMNDLQEETDAIDNHEDENQQDDDQGSKKKKRGKADPPRQLLLSF